MAMKAYVIMKPEENVSLVPVILADSNAEIKRKQNEGYTIIGRVKLDEKFKPEYARITYTKEK